MLLMEHESGHPTPRLTADVVFVCGAAADRRVLLISRARAPFEGMWALPGGFAEQYEPLESAAMRELAEETAVILTEPPSRIVGVYAERGRDPRGWTVSVAYLVDFGRVDPPQPTCGDDAADARWWPLAALPPLAFDHERIVSDALDALGD
jgi:8-oxo-dGTP diphosphatase